MFHLLPSEVEQRATTFDLMVVDVYTAWEKYKADPTDGSQYSEESLLEILKNTRK